MNWYTKIVLSAYNFRLNQDNESDIDRITNAAVDYTISNKKDKEFVTPPVMLENSYTKEQELVYVIIDPSTKENAGNWNPERKTISIFPYWIGKNNGSRQELFDLYRPYVSHEFSHAIDPSIKGEKWKNKNRLGSPMFLRFDEFNAYSKQMSDYLRNIANSNNPYRIEQIKEWMRKQNMDMIPKEIANYKNVLLTWQKNKPEYIRWFFDKLYNDLFRGK